MISRRAILALITSIGAIAASRVALAKKQKKHQNGRALLGDNVKKNGKHKLHKAGKVDVSVDVSNGKVVGLNAAHPTKGNLQVRKVKSRQKLADTQPAVIQTACEWPRRPIGRSCRMRVNAEVKKSPRRRTFAGR